MSTPKKFIISIEERFNAVSHALAAVAAFVGLVFLVYYASNKNYLTQLSSILYGISLLSVFVSSTLYHAATEQQQKKFYQRLDHSCIYLLIAGTYTPLLLVSIGGLFAWALFVIQWTLAFTGIYYKWMHFEAFKKFSLIFYMLMGWLAMIEIPQLYYSLPSNGFWLLIAGGIVYTTGVVFFVLDGKLPFAHFIWHLFVIVASLLHYLVIFNYVL